MNSSVTRWDDNLLKLKKKYTYNYLTEKDIKEIAEKQTRRKYFILKICLYFLSFTILMGIAILIGKYTAIDFSGENLATFTGLFVLSPSMIDTSDERVEIINDNNQITLLINGMRFKYEAKSETAKMMVIVLSQMKVPPAPNRSNHLSHKTIAKCTGFSATWVSKLIKRYQKFGIIGLDRLPEGGILEKKANDKVLSLLAENINYTYSQINEILIEEGHLQKPNPTAVRNCMKSVDLTKLLSAFRAQISGKKANEKLEYLIDKLFSLNKRLLAYVFDIVFQSLDSLAE
jgi:hypothetical protein